MLIKDQVQWNVTSTGEDERLAAECRQSVAVFEIFLLVATADEMIHYGLFDKGFDIERIESPVDRVPLSERVIHGNESRVLAVY